MRNLTREQAPNCLDDCINNNRNWNSLTDAEKDEIWIELNKMQGEFCVYCDSHIIIPRRHIEHFIPQNILKEISISKIFEWDNLFGSCNELDHCGRYKDRVIEHFSTIRHDSYDSAKYYLAENLIKPDSDDTSHFFNYSIHGNITLPSNHEYIDKAKETIRVLNLDASNLINLRKNQIEISKAEYIAIQSICEDGSISEDIKVNLLEDFFANIKSNPFYIAVKQNTIDV